MMVSDVPASSRTPHEAAATMTPVEEHVRELLDAAPDAIVITDTHGMIIYANDQTGALFGYISGDLIGKQVEVLLPERYRAAHSGHRMSYARNPRVRPMGENLELYAQRLDGSEFRVEIRLSALQTDKGLLISSTIRDVTARVDLPSKIGLLLQSGPAKAEHSLQADEFFEERERTRATLNSIGDAVISTDVAGNLRYLNPVAETMTGWLRADATGKPLHEVLTIIDGGSRETVPPPILSSMNNSEIEGATANRVLVRRDGTEFAIEDSAAPMHDDRGKVVGAVMVFRDVSAARAITAKLAYQAQHDALTGLPNRVLLDSRVAHAIALARRSIRPLAVLFVDMDGFKHVNDTLGHPVGDQLLQSIAQRLQHCVRETDTVSRFGGDEFVVLLSEMSRPADAVVCAEKIIDALRMSHDIDSHHLEVTASIGIAVYPDDGLDAEALVKNADRAMLDAKRNGRNAYRLRSQSEQAQ